MPELPEVETIARTLAPQVEGRHIVACRLLHPSTLQGELTLEKVEGKQIGKPGRRGKLLLLPLAGGKKSDGVFTVSGLAFHLKMTGRLFVYPQDTEVGKHTRLILELDNGTCVFFDDARKFGYVRVCSPATLASWPFWNQLGPEPLDITSASFVACFSGRRGKIKSLLLDQSVIAGCGNIYADESLFRAGIRPDARELSPDRLERLHGALKEVLQESIAACGSSIRDYRTARGDAGAFQNAFRVYGRAGESCLVCGTRLEHSRITGRATVYCPHCQKL